MRRVAIIGAGIAGLVLAHGLRRAGYEVTLFSDRTAEQWLAGRPTGIAARFEPALAYERELGLDHWQAEAPRICSWRLVYSPRRGNQLASLVGRHCGPALAIDPRLQSHRWMHELEARGGRIVIEAVSLERLDAIAAEHELTVVAAGRGELAALFEPNHTRSGFTEPQRNLGMVVVVGPALAREDMPSVGVVTYILEGIGEFVFIPFFHRDLGRSWSILFEAKPGGPMDLFRDAKTGAEALAAARKSIETLIPWDAAWARGMQLADEHAWQTGRITPTVRSPVGRLPSGRMVTCIGDTAIHFDPIGAQGANNCVKMAKHLVEHVVARGDRPFDAQWMTETFDRFWMENGKWPFAFTNLLLAPMSAAGRLILLSQYGSDGVRNDGRQALADRLTRIIEDPDQSLTMMIDIDEAKRVIHETTGHSWWRGLPSGVLGIARAQLRQALGLAPGH
jgi:2-polyprenyl-6-methoxyphenol hydroxylase-like FAD-dependent oxidoreductase